MTAFDPDKLIRRQFAPIEQTYTDQHALLHALAVGYGDDPLDVGELPFVYEQGKRVAPTLALVVGYPGFWMMEPDTGIDWRSVLHAGQTLELHDEIPLAGTVVGHLRVTGVADKGPSVGALITTERLLVEKHSGRLLATATQTYLARGNGGFSATVPQRTARAPRTEQVQAAPDRCESYRTPSNAALLYRLCGDRNPLHADPAVARSAGFERPILHGLCTYGIAVRAIVKTVCGYDAARLRRVAARFTAPAYPGETIRTELWTGQPQATRFRVVAADRGQVIMDGGLAEWR